MGHTFPPGAGGPGGYGMGSPGQTGGYGGVYIHGGAGGAGGQGGLGGGALGIRAGDGEVTFTLVPEPSTWAMMLTGFGFIGYLLRRRFLRAA
jgi:PEP-CTERM motif